MQHVSRSAPARPQPQAPRRVVTADQVRVVATSRGGGGAAGRVAPPALLLRARASCVGAGGGTGTEPVEARPQREDESDAEEMVAGELEVLEEAAIAGEDEGRRPTDYDRRAHIFEESSRVFHALKQRRDGDDGREGVENGAGARSHGGGG